MKGLAAIVQVVVHIQPETTVRMAYPLPLMHVAQAVQRKKTNVLRAL